MRILITILSLSFIFSGELEVEGDLKVTGNIEAGTIDSLQQTISAQQQQISELHALIAALQAQITILQNQLGLVEDCMGVIGGDAVVDCNGECNGDNSNCVCIDFDENNYEYVQIGEQVWMAENLRTTRNSSGEYVSYSTSAYELDPDYGFLYDWHTANDEICPEGWHLPSDQEFQILEIYLGMDPDEAASEGQRTDGSVGAKLKEAGDGHWVYSSEEEGNGTNESGFTALPGGYINYINGAYYNEGHHGYYWTSTGVGTDAWMRDLYAGSPMVDRQSSYKDFSFTIRCILD